MSEARELLERAIAEKGADYVYSPVPAVEVDDPDTTYGITCRYFSDGQPSCLVGHILNYKGVEPGEVAEGDAAFDVLRNLDLFSEGERDALSQAQAVQDAGSTWGEALAVFDEEMADPL